MSGYTARELLGALKNPCKIIKHLGGKGYFKWIPDEQYLRLCYRGAFGKKLNLENPVTFNEKLQWLKLYDRNPAYTGMVDKFTAKQYAEEIIGDDYIIPTFGVWDSFDEIDFDSLPEQFVLKCTHDSGNVVICKDKKTLDLPACRKKIESCLKRDFYYIGREWPYKNVPHRIIAEKLLTDNSTTGELVDYKLMCFHGKVKCCFTVTGRFSNKYPRVTFFDTEWNRMPFVRHYPAEVQPVQKPESFDQMIRLAEKLSAGLPFVRVDFYEIEGHPYFGELTLYPGDGFEEFTPDKYDGILGSWIDLEQVHREKHN